MGIVNQAYSDEGTVNSALNRRGLMFDTVAEMVADTKIKLGQFVAAADYAAGNNSGVLFFKAVAAVTGTDDGGSYIDSVGSPSIQFRQNFPSIISVEMFGAGAVDANDTSSMQNAFNYAKNVTLGRNKTYLVDNLVIPDVSGWRLNMNGSTIKKSATGDSYYLVASYKHLNNIAEAQAPITIFGGGVFDANLNADHALIVQSWNSYIECETKNSNSAGCVYSAETRDGTTFPTSSMVNSQFKLKSHDNGGCGFRVRDSARNNATDGHVLKGSYFYNNADHAIFIDSGAGWNVVCNTYNNGAGVGFDGHGAGTLVHDSYIDDGAGVVSALPETGLTYSAAVRGSAALGVTEVGLLPVENCRLNGPVTHMGGGDAAPYGVISTNNIYGDNGFIYHQYFGPTRKMVSHNDTFKNSNPFRFHNGSSTGVIEFSNAFVEPVNRFISGSMAATTDGNYLALKQSSFTYGEALSKKAGSISAGAAFSLSVEVPYIPDYDSVQGTVLINTRANHNGNKRVSYLGMVSVQSKVNGVDSWVTDLTDVVYTAGEWTAPPSVSVADNGDGTGALTIEGEPIDVDGYGRVSVIWR